jgi:sec-independent protein translocase protein TatA
MTTFTTMPAGLIGDVGGLEILMVLFAVLMLFGKDKLPDFARGVGKSIREFKKATAGVEHEIKRAIEDVQQPARIAPPPPPPPAIVALPEVDPEDAPYTDLPTEEKPKSEGTTSPSESPGPPHQKLGD